MSAHSISEFANSVVPDRIVDQAAQWSEEMQKAYFKGLGDTREAARYRLARDIGVPESYMKRLRYKRGELTDIPGSILAKLAIAYDRICLQTEQKADEIRIQRESLRNSDASHQGSGGTHH